MSSIFWKNFYLCLSKFKCFPTALPPPAPPAAAASPAHEDDDTLQTPSIIKNFNSVCHLTSSDSTTKSPTSSSSSDFFFSSSDSSDHDSSPPDFATIFASQRFFFSSPGPSNSIVESPPELPPEPTDPLVAGGVAVQTDSPDPYMDFRRSMQEMVEARQLREEKAADWEYLHELLLCYLTLNPKHTHKCIMGAFSDLLVSLLSSTATDNFRKPECHQCPAVSPGLF